jgi:hypothetical protein
MSGDHTTAIADALDGEPVGTWRIAAQRERRGQVEEAPVWVEAYRTKLTPPGTVFVVTRRDGVLFTVGLLAGMLCPKNERELKAYEKLLTNVGYSMTTYLAEISGFDGPVRVLGDSSGVTS